MRYRNNFTAVVGKRYLVTQVTYNSSSQTDASFGSFSGATIQSKHMIVPTETPHGYIVSAFFRVCVIEATSTTINAFQSIDSNVVTGYCQSDYVAL